MQRQGIGSIASAFLYCAAVHTLLSCVSIPVPFFSLRLLPVCFMQTQVATVVH